MLRSPSPLLHAVAAGLLFAALAAAPRLAAAQDAPAPLRLDFERFTLENGLEVILHEDHRVPLVAVDVWYHVGSGDEQPGRSGFAHLFEHMMFQGSRHTGEDVHFDILREIGASTVNGSTNADRTNYYEVVPAGALEVALWLESDRMGFMLDLLNEKSLANQREVVRNERRQRYDNVAYGRDRFATAAALYPEGHPYRYLTIGRHEDLEAASLQDVTAFFNTWYAPANATLVLAGDFDPKEARRLVERWFGGLPTAPRPPRTTHSPATLPSTVREQVIDPFAKLRRLHLAWHSPPRYASDDLELRLAAHALGATGWGRLERALKLDRRLARNVYVSQYGAQHGGVFHIIVDLNPDADLDQTRDLVHSELKALLAPGGLTQEDLQRATNRIGADLLWSLDTLLNRAEELQAFNHYTGDPGGAAPWLQRLRQATPQQVQRAAAAWLQHPHAEILTLPQEARP